MGRRKKRKSGDGWLSTLKEETVEAVIAIVFIVVAIFLGFAAFDSAGFLGEYTFKAFESLFGIGYYLLPVILIALGATSLATLKENHTLSKSIGGLIIFLSGLGIVGLLPFEWSDGGFVGGFLIAGPLEK